MTTERPRFWSDDFDMDLLKLWPDLPNRLGPAADIALWTHGGESHGRLNHPSVWSTRAAGMAAFFGLTPGQTGKPSGYWTDAPIVECTWLEALRDAWPHGYLLVVDNQAIIWSAAQQEKNFTKLMYDLRGYTKLPDGEADRIKGRVLASILSATRDLNLMRAGVRTT